MEFIAPTPEAPYYAVIFSSHRKNTEGYSRMAEEMEKLARQQPGFLGIESVRDPSTGLGITVSYWRTPADIDAWRENLRHKEAQRRGKEEWYSLFTTRVCRVERVRHWPEKSVPEIS